MPMTLVVTGQMIEGKAAGASQANSAPPSPPSSEVCAPRSRRAAARRELESVPGALEIHNDRLGRPRPRCGSGESAIRARAYLPDVRHDQPAVTRPGDLWLLVRAAFPATAYWPAMRVILLRSPPDGEEQAAMVITDPPFRTSRSRGCLRQGRTRHGEFAMASGEA
jgi:hypothetical protein